GVVPTEIFDFSMNEIPITVGDAGMLCRGHFKGELRKYQQEGASWMRGMLDNNFNVILADEMGLGKTVQTLSVLAADRSGLKEPSLIICPASLVENWNREAQKFVPDFKVAAMIDCDRELVWENAADYDLIIVSYAVARRDGDTIRKIKFNTLVLDEAQHIKNPSTANAQ
ncbi:MAG: SNF2-related protein, partial [Victivallaceae bacterium]